MRSVDDDGEVADGDVACVAAVADGGNACDDDADVGLRMRSVADNGKVAVGDDACDVAVADGDDARDDDADVVGMRSSARPRRLPILILPSIADVNLS